MNIFKNARIVELDPRPARNGWFPGNYFNKCSICGNSFVSHKWCRCCADCAYIVTEPEPTWEATNEL